MRRGQSAAGAWLRIGGLLNPEHEAARTAPLSKRCGPREMRRPFPAVDRRSGAWWRRCAKPLSKRLWKWEGTKSSGCACSDGAAADAETGTDMQRKSSETVSQQRQEQQTRSEEFWYEGGIRHLRMAHSERGTAAAETRPKKVANTCRRIRSRTRREQRPAEASPKSGAPKPY